MTKSFKGFSQKWFLIGLVLLALIGSLAGMYLFENDFVDRLVSKKNSPKPSVAPVHKEQEEEEGTAFQSNISDDKLGKLVGSLSVEEKIGQMLLVGFSGTAPSEEFQAFLREKHLGGVILAESNIESLGQVRKLTNGLQQLATYKEIPLFISTEQEGGLINRINDGLTVFPGNMAVGATKSSEYAYRFGRVTGQELKALGINFNLAPVLDLATKHGNPLVGTRAFGDNPQVVAILGARYIAGLENTGVAAGVKYFPGQGDTLIDAHKALPILSLKKEDLEKRELVPFREVIKQEVTAIVVGHLLFPEIDPRYPASLSDKLIGNLLRSKENLGFDGIIVSDDLTMKAITDNPGTVPGAVQAVKAGADMVIVSNGLQTQKEVYNALVNAVKKGEIRESQINQSVKRILLAKFRYAVANPEKEEQLFSRIASRVHLKWARRITQHSITVVKDEQQAIPLNKEEKLLLLVPSELPANGDQKYLAQLLSKYYPSLEYQEFINYRSSEEKQIVMEKAKKSSVILVATHNAGPNQAALIKDLLTLSDKKLIVVGLGNPWDLELFPEVETYLVTYGYRKVSLEALTRVLAGQIEEDQELGILPVSLREKK